MNRLTSSILYSLYVDHHDKNWVFSPASYLEAMSNLAVCLKGQNLAELVAAAPDVDRPQTLGLETYNCLLYSIEYREVLNQAVIETLAARGGDLKSFVGIEVVDIVNALVHEKTHGKIDSLIKPEDISAFTKFIILNCVYFKKAWVNPFDEMHLAEAFNGAAKKSHVKYLFNKIVGRRYYEGVGYDIVELTYKESDVACYLIVPTTGNVFELFHNQAEVFGHIADVKSGLDVDLKVPPFKIESTFRMEAPTMTAGVTSIFDYNKDWTLVDFEKLAPEAVVKVEKIIQKAYIDFTKDGTEAAAATAILCAMSGCCFMPVKLPEIKVIRADKPFIYVLADKNEPTKPLFVGVVNEVQDSPPGTSYVDKIPREDGVTHWNVLWSGIQINTL